MIVSFIVSLDTKSAKKEKRELKEDIAKSVVATVVESIDLKIQNEVEKATMNTNLAISNSSQSDLTAKMDQFDLKHEEMDKKVDDLTLDLARITDKANSASDRAIRLEEWKNSGLLCSKEDLFLFAWGIACLQTR